MESMIRDGVHPRIPGFATRPINLSNGNFAFVMFIPQSWVGPHMVAFKNSSRFFSQEFGRKIPIGCSGNPTSVSTNNSVNERIKNFRLDRLGKIIAGETPVPMDEGAKVILHFVPIISFQTLSHVNLKSTYDRKSRLETLSGPPNSFRYNLEGIVSSLSVKPGRPVSYVQIFRNGVIEAVDSLTFQGQIPQLHSTSL